MKKFSTNIRVRYGETDQMGVVYHGNYASYFEIARTEWLRNLGVTYKELENKGIMLPVISLFFNFIKSAKYDDVLTITVILKKKPLVKIEFDYEIYNQKKEKISTGNSVLAFMDMKTNKPLRCLQQEGQEIVHAVPKRTTQEDTDTDSVGRLARDVSSKNL